MSKKKKRVKVVKVPCPHCGKPEQEQYIFTCPRCYRKGCDSMKCIMPMGIGVACIDCENEDAK